MNRFGYRAIIIATVVASYFSATLIMLELDELLPAPWSAFYGPCLIAAIPIFILAARSWGIAVWLAAFGRQWQRLIGLSVAAVIFLLPFIVTQPLHREILKMTVASDIAQSTLPPGSRKLSWRWTMESNGDDTYLLYDETVPAGAIPQPVSGSACKANLESLGDHFFAETYIC